MTVVQMPTVSLDVSNSRPVSGGARATPRLRPAASTPVAPVAPDVELVVPVYNEETDLVPSIRRLHEYLTERLPWTFRLTIADNASTDTTWRRAQMLAQDLPGVRAVHLEAKGRGRALAAVWATSDAAVVAYTDVDLSTDLDGLLPLLAPLLSGHSDLAIGTRLARGARVVRGPKREAISRSYNLILRTALHTRFTDAQCGFKAIRSDRAALLLPHVADRGWFFDTELLVLAERAGLRIHEVPVDWVDDPDSRVDLLSTAWHDLRGIGRLLRGFADGSIPVAAIRAEIVPAAPTTPPSLLGQVVRFGLVGIASTLAYLLLFVGLRRGLGGQGANALALALTAVANTAANRRWTFAAHTGGRAVTHHVQGLAVFGLALALTAGSLAVLHATVSAPATWLQVTVLTVANLAATLLRFLLLRSWVFRAGRS